MSDPNTDDEKEKRLRKYEHLLVGNSAPSGRLVLTLTLVLGLIALAMFALLAYL